MKNTLLLIVLSVVLVGCGINVKRNVNDNVLVSNSSPAIQLNIPKSYELVDSSSGKRYEEYHDGFSGTQSKEEWYYFTSKNIIDNSERTFFVVFNEVGVHSYILSEIKDKDAFNHDNMLFKGLNYQTYFKVNKRSFQQEGESLQKCVVEKVHRKVLPPNHSRSFVMVYGESVPCDDVMANKVGPSVISGVNIRAIEFMNSL
ncbi:hypothetical protein [Zooshikella sp. RANM57]|uniref:hypothetical protein n=1 Tax=Zooshikella sp. RANM57 TaxID=3425863 RepID=UPI003D6ED3C9